MPVGKERIDGATPSEPFFSMTQTSSGSNSAKIFNPTQSQRQMNTRNSKSYFLPSHLMPKNGESMLASESPVRASQL